MRKERLMHGAGASSAGAARADCSRKSDVAEARRRRCGCIEAFRKGTRKIRGGEIAYIFQEPSVSLNPVFRVGEQIAEAVSLHRPDVADPWAEAVELLRRVGIPEPRDRVSRYPLELSGGMQQRVMIAGDCEPSVGAAGG